ncbi:haloacid dehalogenase-like hydrolase [Lysobacter korlensis]|uniref:Haloacid dehalogenase-like hydrolase n=1 Tax=Lysobacter korlensis TaxID=553636 RepID=A0ABV6RTI1_9GAMM
MCRPAATHCAGQNAGRQCDGEEKVRRIRATFDLAACDEVHAYGDSPGDRAMLALAGHRYYRGREQR